MARPDKVPVNDLRRSWAPSSPEVQAVVADVIASGRYIHGPYHAAFETQLAAHTGTPHAVGVANGTDALAIALLAVGCGPGDEVIVAANAGGYAAIAAAMTGCSVVYADVSPTNLLMQPEAIGSALGPHTRAVVVTHLYGNVADVTAISAICRPRGIAVIEDCAQAIGATDGRNRVGSLGDIAAFSFYPTKNLGAIGDAGALTTADDRLAEKARQLRQYGWSSRYRISSPSGRNSRLDELQAAVLGIGLSRIDELNTRRRAILEAYREAAGSGGLRVVTGEGCSTVAHLAVVRTPARAALVRRLEAAAIGWDVHYPIPDHRQPSLPAPARVTPLPATELAVDEILTLPCFPELTEAEVDRVADVISMPL